MRMKRTFSNTATMCAASSMQPECVLVKTVAGAALKLLTIDLAAERIGRWRKMSEQFVGRKGRCMTSPAHGVTASRASKMGQEETFDPT
jgi:hypothetical protein